MDSESSHATQLKRDVLQSVQALLAADPSLAPVDAVRIAASRMLVNNPFVPPTKGCPVNDLPNEILAHIFALGAEMEEEEEAMDSDESDDEYEDQPNLLDGWDTDEDEGRVNPQGKVVQVEDEAMDVEADDEDYEDEDEDEDEEEKPFQILVSHVCQHWRNVAIESPGLWTKLAFHTGFSLDCARTWIQRSKGLPLDICIDCTIPDAEFIVENEYGMHPHDTSSPAAIQMHVDAALAGTPIQTNYYSQRELNEILDLIIPHADKWRSFELAVSFYRYMYTLLSRLEKCAAAPLLEVLMLYHYETCDDYEAFAQPEFNDSFLLFHGNAPRLRETAFWGVHIAWEPSLELELAYHAKDVRPSFSVFQQLLDASPNLRTLTLCLLGPRGHFAQQLAQPMPGKTKSLLAGLAHLKISGLPCSNRAAEEMFVQLGELKSVNLNCSGAEEPRAGTGGKNVYCPRLETLTTTGIDGHKMRRVPLKNEREEKWLRAHLESLEFFEPSKRRGVDEEEEGEGEDQAIGLD
ncbi:hypothetical protein BD779DRAFT_1608982 [Infundibulicybe gibba]|nr:hypothetical protein BD779DRAFT_1608982 [Infundibulicybe gibba]